MTLDWDALASHFIHPTKLCIVEAMLWIDEPLSASDLERVLSGEVATPVLSYHLKTLVELQAIEEVHGRQARRATERFFLPAATALAPA